MELYTEIIAVIDRSGSMSTIAKDMEGGFNEFIAEQKKGSGKCLVTLIQFDAPQGPETLYTAKPLAEVPPMSLIPRGGTPLLDALGVAIVSNGERFAKQAEKPDKVIVMVITDGEENASREYTKEQVREKVKHQEANYGWQFIYLGANVDSFKNASALGFSASNVANYNANSGSVKAMYASASANTLRSRSSVTASVSFDDEQRKKILTQK